VEFEEGLFTSSIERRRPLAKTARGDSENGGDLSSLLSSE
jgi:hypothetical protein